MLYRHWRLVLRGVGTAGPRIVSLHPPEPGGRAVPAPQPTGDLQKLSREPPYWLTSQHEALVSRKQAGLLTG